MTTATSPTVLTTTVIGRFGAYWLHGWREARNGTARFTITHTQAGVDAGLEGVAWPDAWAYLVQRGVARPEPALRSVLRPA